MTDAKWAEFVAWAERLVEAGVDIEGEEHRYKRMLATQLSAWRQSFDEGSEEWVPAFVKEVTNSRLINYFTMMRLDTAVAGNMDGFMDAVSVLWGESDPQPADLAEFDDRIRQVWPEITPGNVVALGAVLLMGRDVEQFPPYRPTFVNNWGKLVDVEIDNGSAVSRYEGLLRLCDELLQHAPEELAKTRLEAQGVGWTVLMWSPEDLEISDEEGAALDAWRMGQDSLAPGHSQRAWLVRPKPGGDELAARWFDEGIVSMRAAHLKALSPGASKEAVGAAVDRDYQHQDYSQRAALTSEYHAFLSQMAEGDLIATVVDGTLRVGVVAGEAEYRDDLETRLARGVEWTDVRVSRADVPAPLNALLDHQGVVVDITGGTDVLDSLLQRPHPVQEDDEQRAKVEPDRPPSFPPVTDRLAATLHTDRASLQSIVDVLQSRQKIVLYGPPGTGKTYFALEIAKHLVGDDTSRAQLVQFHPSYSYEDFFEGYRPEVKDGQSTFVLKHGPLRTIAQEASNNRGTPYILIIDEMNRGNLAKIFGELYFLLEYRDRSINLQYSPSEAFTLPKNLFIIGTMNTADRSIAMVDAAIRRRFAFIEMHPSEPPVAGVLSRYVEANRVEDDRAQLLDALNAAIGQEDRDLQIGPSYFMRGDVSQPGGIERVFDFDLLPLLEEHYYGRMSRDRVRELFGLDALRKAIATEEAQPEEAVSADHDPGAMPTPEE